MKRVSGLRLLLLTLINNVMLADSIPVLNNFQSVASSLEKQITQTQVLPKLQDGQNKQQEHTKATNAPKMQPNETLQETDEDAMDIIIKENKDLNSSDLWEGDIVLDKQMKAMLKYYRGEGPVGRNAIFSRHSLWTTRKIPYVIPPYMSHIKPNFYKAINEIHKYTCVRFVPYSGEKNRIRITNDAGCSSTIGRSYYHGYQTLSLQGICNNVGTIIHELLHALGFFHEQSRPDRDSYVKIHWNNIISNRFNEFEKYPEGFLDLLEKSYDYRSIMHYSRTSFSKNGKPTIEAVGNPTMKLGGEFLSEGDIKEIKQLYDCETTRYGWTRWSSFTPCDQTTCYRERQRYCYNGGNVKICGKDTDEYGHDRQREKCPKTICPKPVDGQWSPWSAWQRCSKTCGDGISHRTRKCTDPPPKNEGKQCVGKDKETKVCTLQRCQLDYDDADFENKRLGMWSNDYNDQRNWEFLKYGTRTAGTGTIEGDHTLTPSGFSHGYYLYVRSGFGNTGDKVRLVSSWIQPQSELRCLNFYYFMRGKGMGSLSVKVKLQGENNEGLWFVKYGEQKHAWLKGILTIGFKKTFQIIIEATIGKPWSSDIAIDDIYLDPGPCNCQDTYWTGCQAWLKTGECKKNKQWMWKHCPRSCGTCACKDKNKNCAKWAQSGECKKNPVWMLRNCLLSCEVCDCFDDDDGCDEWAKGGLCTQTKWQQFMKDHCSKSCEFCSS